MDSTSSSSTPEHADAPTITVSFRDVEQGRAYIRIPFVARLLLCHWAGAPWSDKDPDAHLHALQVECQAHKERERLIHGASRLGKSVLGGCDLLVAQMRLRRKIAVVAKRYDHVAHEFQYLHLGLKTLFADTPQAMTRLIFKHQMNYHDYDAETIWGSRTIGISVEADDGAQLLGREFTDVVCGEASHIPPHIGYTKLLRALDGAMMGRAHGADEEIGYLSIYTTPKEEEGFSAAEYERVMKQTARQPEQLHYGNVDFAETCWIREADIRENPAYNIKVYEARKRTLDKHAFAEQYGGKMLRRSGRVLSSFDELRHVVPFPADLIRSMRLGVGIDTGGCMGMVLAGLTKDWKRYALGEVYTEKYTIWQTLETFDQMLVDVLGPVYDCDDPVKLRGLIDVWAIDPASQVKIDIMDAFDIGLQTPMTRDERSILQTTGQMDQWFLQDELFVASGYCETLVEQIKKYVWKRVAAAKGSGSAATIKEPLKQYDHLIDAWRMVLIVLEHHGPLETPPAPLTMKEAWEAAQKEAVFGPLRQHMAAGRQLEEALRARWEG
jgi:hypothetical protein